MKTYLQMDGDRLVEYVEKAEYDLLSQDRASFGALVDKLDRELDAAKALIESLEDVLIEIEACCYEDNSSNLAADASWHLARKALKKLNEHNK